MIIPLSTDYNRKRAIEEVKRADACNVVEIKSPPKTNPQLRLAFKWVKEIQVFFAETCGKAYTQDQIRAWLNGLFLAPQTAEINGIVVEVPVSWAKLERLKMALFMDEINRHCAVELGLYLTLPGVPSEN